MASPPAKTVTRPREFRNISVTDILGYRLPPGAMVSILHRVSGAILFVLLPLLVWMFDHSLTSEISYERFTALFDGLLFVPGWLVKLVVLGMIWAAPIAPRLEVIGWPLRSNCLPPLSACRIEANRRLSGLLTASTALEPTLTPT